MAQAHGHDGEDRLGIGTREQNLLHLGAIKEKQANIVEAGGMNLLVTPQNIYQTARST